MIIGTIEARGGKVRFRKRDLKDAGVDEHIKRIHKSMKEADLETRVAIAAVINFALDQVTEAAEEVKAENIDDAAAGSVIAGAVVAACIVQQETAESTADFLAAAFDIKSPK